MHCVRLTLLLFLGLIGLACSENEKEGITESPVATIAGGDLSDEPHVVTPQIQIAEGNILSIDTERKFLGIKLRDGGDEMIFRYTPNTQVQGFGDLAQGLSDKFTVDSLRDVAKGAAVRVHYRSDGDLVVPYTSVLKSAVKIELDRPLE